MRAGSCDAKASSAPGISRRDAGTHEYVVHAGEHRAVQGGKVWHLNLGEQIDSDLAIMPFFREPDLDEICQHGQLLALCAHDSPVHRQQLVGHVRRAAAGHEEALEHSCADFWYREVPHRATHVALGVAILKSPSENGVDRGTRHDTKLSVARYGIGEPPVGDGHAHASLDNLRKRQRPFSVEALFHRPQAK